MKNISAILLMVAATLLLHGCKRNTPEACQPFPKENGYTYVTGEGAGVKLRLPSWAGIVPTNDCSHVRSVNMSFLWYQGKLHPMDGKFELLVPSTDFHRIWVGFGGFSEKNDLLRREEEVSAWKHEGGVPHEKYPLEFYPHSPEAPHSRDGLMWGIRNTTDPITGRPFRASCDITPTSKDLKSAARGEFSKHGDSKCAVYIRLVKGEKAAVATIYVWAKSADHIDQIVNSIQAELINTIMEK